MGLIGRILDTVFGNGANALKDTVEVFRENAESASARASGMQSAALRQFSAEFSQPQRSRFDRLMDGVNRLPRPLLALGTLGLFVSAMIDPVWFAARMQGIALVPEPLWWLLGAIVSFYFGARHQAKGQELQRQISRTLAVVPRVTDNLRRLKRLGAATPGVADTGTDADLTLRTVETDGNAALHAWQRGADIGR